MSDSFSRYDTYTTVGSIYCYKGTGILINRFGIKDSSILKNIEADIFAVKQSGLYDNPVRGYFTPNHLCCIHRYLFGDVYYFAGNYRREDIMKGNTRFAPNGQIKEKLNCLLKELKTENYLSGLSYDELISRSAYYFAELNYIHPFREGNGRAIREFMRLLYKQAGYDVDWNKYDRKAMLIRMEESIFDYRALIPMLHEIVFLEQTCPLDV